MKFHNTNILKPFFFGNQMTIYKYMQLRVGFFVYRMRIVVLVFSRSHSLHFSLKVNNKHRHTHCFCVFFLTKALRLHVLLLYYYPSIEFSLAIFPLFKWKSNFPHHASQSFWPKSRISHDFERLLDCEISFIWNKLKQTQFCGFQNRPENCQNEK